MLDDNHGRLEALGQRGEELLERDDTTGGTADAYDRLGRVDWGRNRGQLPDGAMIGE